MEVTEPAIRTGQPIRLSAIHPNARRMVRQLTQGVTVIGSAEGSDLILSSSSIAASHAAIVRWGRRAYLCDLGAEGGTSINGQKIRWSWLNGGDEIALGPFRFHVDLAAGAEQENGPLPEMRLSCDRLLTAYESDGPMLLIGSDPACDVVIGEEAVLPRHALIVFSDQGAVLRDLRRRYHTRHNGRRVNVARLKEGDQVGIGAQELIFALRPAGETPTSVDESFVEDVLGQAPSALISGRLSPGQRISIGELCDTATSWRADHVQETLADLPLSAEELIALRNSETQPPTPPAEEGIRTAELQSRARRTREGIRALGAELPASPPEEALESGEPAAGPDDAAVLAAQAEVERLAAVLADVTARERSSRHDVQTRMRLLRSEVAHQDERLKRDETLSERQLGEVQARMGSLQQRGDLLVRQREAAVARLRDLDARLETVNGLISEGQRAQSDLDQKLKELAQQRRATERKRKELRRAVELEQNRLRAGLAEIQRKSEELALAVRRKREAQEQALRRRREDLHRREAQLESWRAEVRRAEQSDLQQTAARMEQLLGGLLETTAAEAEQRETELQQWMHDFGGEAPQSNASDGTAAGNGNGIRSAGRASTEPPGRPVPIERGLDGEGQRHVGRTVECGGNSPGIESAAGRFQQLQKELEAIRRRLAEFRTDGSTIS